MRALPAYAGALDGSLPRSVRSTGDNRALADLLARAFGAGRGAAWLAGLPEALTAVRAEDVQRVAGEYLTPHGVEIEVAGRPELGKRLSFVGRSRWAQASAKP